MTVTVCYQIILEFDRIVKEHCSMGVINDKQWVISWLDLKWVTNYYRININPFHWGKAKITRRHNGRDGISNHQPHHCLPNRLFRCRSKETSKLCVTALCAGNSPGTDEFPAQMASNVENVSIWWRHHVSVMPLSSLSMRNLGRQLCFHFNTLWLGYATQWHNCWSTLAHVTVCCDGTKLLKQCWLVIKGALWHLPKSNFTRSIHKLNP